MAVWSGIQYTDTALLSAEERAQPAMVLMRSIKSYATSHSAWTVADESVGEVEVFNAKGVLTGVQVFPMLTLKNSGESNVHGVDFYVTFVAQGLAKADATGATGPAPFLELRVAVSEEFSPNSLVRPIPGKVLELTSPAADGSVGADRGYPVFNEEDPVTKKPLINFNTLFMPAMRLGGMKRFRYGIYVTNNTLAITLGAPGPAGGTMTVTVAGMFQSLLEQDPCPLFLSVGKEARVSRMPYVVASQPDNWVLKTSFSPGTRWTIASGVLNQGGDLLHSGRPIASRLVALHKGRTDTHGGLRGVFLDAEQFLSGFPPQIGDIVVLDGSPMAVIDTFGKGSGGSVGTTTVVDLNRP